MSFGIRITIGLTIMTVLLALICAGYVIGLNNTSLELRERVKAQVEVRDANFDKTWKVIKQQAQLTDKYAEDFKNVYKEMLQGRYGSDGSKAMWQWITEQNPTLNSALYTTLAATIESQRQEFFYEQKKLISYNQEYVVYRKRIPNSLFIGDDPNVEFNIITSDVTREAAATGSENDITL